MNTAIFYVIKRKSQAWYGVLKMNFTGNNGIHPLLRVIMRLYYLLL